MRRSPGYERCQPERRLQGHAPHVEVRLLLAVAALTLTISGCGGDDDQTAATSAERAYNQADAAFVGSMVHHHEGGVELGELAVDKGGDPQVKQLGKGIAAEQGEEIKTLERLVRDQGADDHAHRHRPSATRPT